MRASVQSAFAVGVKVERRPETVTAVMSRRCWEAGLIVQKTYHQTARMDTKNRNAERAIYGREGDNVAAPRRARRKFCMVLRRFRHHSLSTITVWLDPEGFHRFDHIAAPSW